MQIVQWLNQHSFAVAFTLALAVWMAVILLRQARVWHWVGWLAAAGATVVLFLFLRLTPAVAPPDGPGTEERPALVMLYSNL